MEWIAGLALMTALCALWNAHAVLGRVKRLEDRTDNRIPDENYNPAFSRPSEKR